MILGTEVNEFVSNRQQSKIHYLSEENRSLQEYIQDLESALKLNKQAMTLTLEGLNKRPQLTTDNSTMSTGYNYPNSQLERVIQLLNEENQKLIKGLSKQQAITQQLQTKILLQEQISEEQQDYYKDLIGDLEYKLIELKRNVHDKEYAIQELERMKPIQEREGQFYKMIEIVSPSEQNLRLHEELVNVRNLLNKITQEAQTLSDTNIALKEGNYFLKREMFKIRIVLRSQINFQTMKNFVYDEYLDKTDENLQINREVQNQRGKLEQMQQDLCGTSCLGYGFSPEPQQLKYLSKNERMIYQEKLHKMEMMVKGFKELFEKEKNANLHIRQLYNDLLTKYDYVIDTNQLIIKSNNLKDERNEKQQIELQFYKKQSQSLMEQLRNRKVFNSIPLNQEQDIAVGIFSPRYQQKQLNNNQSQSSSSKVQQIGFDDLEIKNSNKQLINLNNQLKTKEINLIQSNQPKKQIQQLDIEDDSLSIEQERYICQTARGNNQITSKLNQIQQEGHIYQYLDMSKEECIEFLMSMFNDYFKKFDLSNVKKQQLMNQIQNRQSNKRSIKRSYSNPYLYFSNVNAITFNKPPKQSVIALAKNEIQLLVAEIQTKKQKQIQNGVFSVDVSKIDMKQNKRQMFENDLSFISNLDGQE
ncbi:unnamed protein product [Paramecium pentaurelia]|uniref:Uncharacterized protein n=1 Tax=Paramecium pentaurelia TaxID=43138 RepID=A0A8S1YCZ7_9CILI|nr:unnamed protein product [Paramecium pentaurelia]